MRHKSFQRQVNDAMKQHEAALNTLAELQQNPEYEECLYQYCSTHHNRIQHFASWFFILRKIVLFNYASLKKVKISHLAKFLNLSRTTLYNWYYELRSKEELAEEYEDELDELYDMNGLTEVMPKYLDLENFNFCITDKQHHHLKNRHPYFETEDNFTLAIRFIERFNDEYCVINDKLIRF